MSILSRKKSTYIIIVLGHFFYKYVFHTIFWSIKPLRAFNISENPLNYAMKY